MTPVADVGTTLEVLAGVSLLLGITMGVYWGTRSGHPGFGLWTHCNILVAISCLLLAGRSNLPAVVVTVVVPGLIILGTVLRLEGIRRFLGRERFDYRTLVLPVVAVALLADFEFAHPSDLVRTEVFVGAFVLVSAAMAAVLMNAARQRRSGAYWGFGGVAVLSALVALGYGIYWAVGEPMPLIELTTPNLIFLVLIAMFEISWLVIFLAMGMVRTTQQLQAANREIENSRAQLATLVAFLPDATFAIDAGHNLIAWNRAAEDVTGVAASELVGKSYKDDVLAVLGSSDLTLLDLVLDPSLEAPARYVNFQRDGDKLSAEMERDFPRSPGPPRHLWVTATALREPGGRVIGAIESMRDVSGREEAERIIRQREQQYRALFELNLDGILQFAPDGSIQDANPAACHMLGMTKEEICAAGQAGLLQDSGLERSLVGRTPAGMDVKECTLVRKDGTTFPAQCMSVAYCDNFGFSRAFVEFRDVTEQKRAQEVLRESEARLLQAQAVAHVGNWELDLVARTVWLSPETLRIHGVDQYQSYMPFDETDVALLGDDPTPLRAAVERVMREGGQFELEYQIKRRNDGASRRLRSRGEAVSGDDGAPVKIVGVSQDITELRHVEDALRLTQYSVDHAGDQVFWLDSTAMFAFVSDSTLEQLGYTRDELLSMSIFDLDPTVSPDRWPGYWAELKESGCFGFETIHRTKAGVDIPVEVRATYIVHDGRAYSFVFAHDITQRKQWEESLRRMQLSVDHAGDHVFWISSQGKFVFVADSTCRQLGYSRDELLEMTIYDVDPTLSRDWRSNWETVRQRGTFTHEAVHRTKHGVDIPVEARYNYISHEGQEYNLVIARDITERKRTEELLEVSQEKLRQAQTMEAIGQMAGGIAHDFNNLLTAIIGYGNLILASEDAQGKVIARDAEEIRAAAERASALTNQILAFSRRQTLVPQVAALNELVLGLVDRVRDLLGETVEVDTILQPEPSLVEVDVGQFEQVIMNLVSNARDAMPAGGRLIIETRNVKLDEDYCRVYPDLHPGDYALLSISDTGVGMTLETMGHVFEPFFTTKPPGMGSGLGLSMVYGIVHQSGGYVNVYSEVGKGSTFKIYLPVVGVKPAAPGDEVEPALPALVSGTETILVVEDEAPLRRLVARVLGGLGYRVFVAGSGPEALELLEDLEQPPDLLLSDVILPGGMQGNEVAAAFTERIPGLPVLYVSGHARDAIVHSGRLDEGVNFLGKPFTPESLAAKVREVLDSTHRD